MSTEEQIREVYEQEIRQKTKLVEEKSGILAFYDGCKNMRVFKMYETDPCWTRYQGEK